ncbi:pectate lyase [soil metagenome]
MLSIRSTAVVAFALLIPGAATAEEPPLREQAAEALKRGGAFFRSEVSTEGGYLWRYSEDLETREGEGRAGKSTAWVQPPGTPSIGLAFLSAWEATGDMEYLEAARETAMALVRGQLQSGGWDYRIEFDPEDRRRYAYRVDGAAGPKARNTSTLDDNTTQAALRFLMRTDQALDFEDALIHDAVEFALTSLLRAQYPNGAWPQRFDAPPNPAEFPVLPASYPEQWSRTHPSDDYRGFYTLNDNSQADTLDTMLLASSLYHDPQYKEAAARGGDFLILAQMPDPQPAWAQQYNLYMHPAWARRFEPPSVTGGESIGAMRSRFTVYRATGNPKYLEPIPRALEYLRESRLPDGRLARFYELQTNRPLYFNKEYELTHSDADMPTHYAFKVADRTDAIARQYERLSEGPAPESETPARPRLTSGLESETQQIINDQDENGRWIESGRLRYHGDDAPTRRVIDSRTFIKNVETLSRYLRASRPE